MSISSVRLIAASANLSIGMTLSDASIPAGAGETRARPQAGGKPAGRGSHPADARLVSARL
jgi:hypothetical protein